MIKRVSKRMIGIKPLAVFHSDCVVRGRFSLNRILKDELSSQDPITNMQGREYSVAWIVIRGVKYAGWQPELVS